MRKGLVLFAIFFLTFLFSCKKDGKLSPDFDNNNLTILFTDTFSLKTSLVKEDSLRSDLAIFNLLGLYNDDLFGPTSSSIYTQVTLTGLNVDFGSATPTLDSIVLTLDYLGLYGDETTPISINVYELTDPFSTSDPYFSNDTSLAYNPVPIGSISNIIPNLSDSVNLVFQSEIKKPHLRIKLSDAFGQSIMAADANGSNDLTDNVAFTAFMKGLYITTNETVSSTSLAAGTGSILQLDMNSEMSTVTLYYHTKNKTSTNQLEDNNYLKYDFTINTDGVKYSQFAHNYSGKNVEKHLNNDPTRDSTVTYISRMAGVKTKLEIPNIKDIIADGNVIINKAELVLTIENLSEDNFAEAMSTLSVVGIDENGSATFIPDFFEGSDYYGGGLDATARTYSFNIARHINDLVYSTTTDYGMYIISNGASSSPGRSVIGTDKNLVSTMKLNITYSKL